MLLRRGALLFSKVIRQIARSHGSKNRRFWPKLGVSGLYLQFGITDGYKMMHKACSSIEEVPYCFSRSSVKFQGHTALKIVEFDPNWAFPDYRPVAAFKSVRFALFWGHPSNFKVTRTKNRRFESNLSKITRPVAAIKSLRFALFKVICQISRSHGSKNCQI